MMRAPIPVSTYSLLLVLWFDDSFISINKLFDQSGRVFFEILSFTREQEYKLFEDMMSSILITIFRSQSS